MACQSVSHRSDSAHLSEVPSGDAVTKEKRRKRAAREGTFLELVKDALNNLKAEIVEIKSVLKTFSNDGQCADKTVRGDISSLSLEQRVGNLETVITYTASQPFCPEPCVTAFANWLYERHFQELIAEPWWTAIPAHELARECDAARTIQRNWKRRSYRIMRLRSGRNGISTGEDYVPGILENSSELLRDVENPTVQGRDMSAPRAGGVPFHALPSVGTWLSWNWEPCAHVDLSETSWSEADCVGPMELDDDIECISGTWSLVPEQFQHVPADIGELAYKELHRDVVRTVASQPQYHKADLRLRVVATLAAEVIYETWIRRDLGKIPRTASSMTAITDLLAEDVRSAVDRLSGAALEALEKHLRELSNQR